MSTEPRVIVVGGGLAGLSAAVEAATHSAVQVLLFDKEQRVGGNSAKATSGINALITESGDTVDAFVKDTIQSGGDPKLVQKLVEKSREALDWLKRQDNELDLSVVSQCGGHSFPRTFRCPPTPDGRPLPVGWRLVQALQKRLQTLPNVKVVTQSPVAELVLRNQKVAGVKTKQEEQPSNAIVLASGGFAGKLDSWLMRQYAPDLVHLATTNGPWATGDGVRLGLAAGAAVRDMDQVQIHPTGFIDLTDPNNPTKFLAPESLRAYGAILLDAKVHRFANELAQRDVLTRAIFDSTASTESPYQLPACTTAAYLVINDAMASQFGMETLEFYIHKDFFIQCQGIQGLAEYLRVDSENLRKEFEVYDDCAQHKKSDPFGKTVFPRPILAGASHFWVALVTPCVHYTMGGLKINEEAQVIASETDQPIPGFYAAGEVTGGVHGSNRLAGNSLLECVVYGRTASRNAALYAMQSA